MPERVVVSARIDITTLAEVALFLDEAGVPPSSRSDLMRRAFKVLSAAGIDEGLSRRISDPPEAVNVLDSYGITFEGNKKTSAKIAGMLSEETLKDATTDKETQEALDEVFADLQEEQEEGEEDMPPSSIINEGNNDD